MLRDSVPHLACYAILAAALALAYSPVVTSLYRILLGDASLQWHYHVFYDDEDNFTNPGAREILRNPALAWLPSRALIFVYEPVAWLGKAAVAAVLHLGGIKLETPAASLMFRAATLLLHWINTCLLLEATRIVLRFTSGPPKMSSLELLGCCLPASLAFALHPTHAEVVGWASCISYGLALLFSLWGVIEYLTPRRTCRQAVAPPALYAAAVFSKSAALLWPVVYVLIDVIGATVRMQPRSSEGAETSANGETLRAFTTDASSSRETSSGRPSAARSSLTYAAQKAPFAAVAVAVALVSIRVNDGGSALTTDVIWLSPWQRVAKSPITVWLYMRLLVWPMGLRARAPLRASELAAPPNSLDISEAFLAATWIWMLTAVALLHLGSLVWATWRHSGEAGAGITTAAAAAAGAKATPQLKSCLAKASKHRCAQESGKLANGTGSAKKHVTIAPLHGVFGDFFGSSTPAPARGLKKGAQAKGGDGGGRSSNGSGNGSKESSLEPGTKESARAGEAKAAAAASAAAASRLVKVEALQSCTTGSTTGDGGHVTCCYPLLAWLAYLAVFLPVSGLVQHGVVTKGGDRYAYLTYPAFVPLLAGALRRWVFDCGSSRSSRRLVAARAAAGWLALLPLLAALGQSTNAQVRHWRSDEALLRRSLAVEPDDWRANDLLVDVLRRDGRLEEAEARMEQLQRDSTLADVPGSSPKKAMFYAKYAAVRGDLQAACAIYREELAKWPRHPHLLYNVGICFLHDAESGNFDSQRQRDVAGVQYLARAAAELKLQGSRNARDGHDALHDMQSRRVVDMAREHQLWATMGYLTAPPGEVMFIF